MSRTVSGQTTGYTWEAAAGLPVILQDSQGNTYVYGLDLISRTDSGGNQEYYLYDGLGSTTDLTDGSGNSTVGYGYDVFGAIRSQSGSSPNEFKFTGEQVDSSGLQYLRARYYDPAIGRFVGRDPIPAVNPYLYVGDNPVNYVDPSGLCHERLGWDQMCGYWAHNKEGDNFASTTTTRTRQVTPEPCYIVAGLTGCVHPESETLCTTATGQPYVCPKPPPGNASCWICGAADTVLEALTSDCAQGIGALLGATTITAAAVFSGAAFIQAGGVLTYSASAAATSAAASGATTLGPVPSETLNRLLNFSETAGANIGSCVQ